MHKISGHQPPKAHKRHIDSIAKNFLSEKQKPFFIWDGSQAKKSDTWDTMVI